MSADLDPSTRRDEASPDARRVLAPAPGALLSQVTGTVAPAIKRGPLRVLRRTVVKAWGDRILGLSAEAAFWQLLSVPPLILAVLGSVGYLGQFLPRGALDSIQNRMTNALSSVFTPEVIDELIAPTLRDVLQRGRLDLVSIGFLLSLWAGSSAMSTFVNTITIAYDQRDVRNAVRSRLMALRIYLVFVLLSVLSLPLLILGPGLLVDLAPTDYQHNAAMLINAVYWPFVLLLLVVELATLYRVVLPRRPAWHHQLPGALLAVAIFVLGGMLVREYISYVLVRAFSYGALAAPIAALLFLFLIGLAVIFGAELNSTIARMWPSRPSRTERRRLVREAMIAERSGVTLLVL